MFRPILVATLLALSGVCDAQTICDGGLKTLRFSVSANANGKLVTTTPAGINGSESAIKVVGKEAIYFISLRPPACTGKATVVGAERGVRVSGGESGTTVWGKTDTGGWVHVTQDDVHHAGASIRMSVNDKETCRINDGETVPPGPGPWASTQDFDNYHLTCAKQEYTVSPSAPLRVMLARWNTNASPLNFDFIVTFQRTGGS